MRIDKITFYNYKAFYSSKIDDVYTLDIPEGKNLLIYGENGSGKSSIFEGLEDLLLSSINTSQYFNQNIFSIGTIAAKPEPFIEANFLSDPQSYIFSTETTLTNTDKHSFIKDSNTGKSFLSYKELLKTYFIRDEEELNLFELLVGNNGIIRNINNPSGVRQNYSQGSFGNLWRNIKYYAASRRNSWRYKSALKLVLDDFNNGLDAFLNLLGSSINIFLNEFDPNTELIEFTYSPVLLNDVQNVKERLTGYKVIPIIKYYGKKIDEFSSFLNEARLTSLAISIYFASLFEVPPPPFKFLFLDDIFIGLDTNNRLPLLKILKDKFIKDYQIFIATYDRAWFELARDFLGNNWHSIEIYTNKISTFPTPAIISSSSDYLIKAKEYFNSFDYPAAGNYLRKECEKLIKKLLPINYRITQSKDFGTNDDLPLETLFNQLIKFYDDCNTPIPIELDEAFRTLKKTILNPLSHDDLKNPLYRVELEQMFTVVDKLKTLDKIERSLLLKSGDKIAYNNSDHNYKAIVELSDYLYKVQTTSTKTLAKCSYKLIHWSKDGVDFFHNGAALPSEKVQNIVEQKRPLKEILDGILKSLGLPEEVNPHIFFQIGSSGTIQDLIDL
jgi:energy-coupling factor transporter ATP-binding protein EcfA2